MPWSHYVKLLTVKDTAARTFYEEEALRGGWSVRQLDRQIGSLFYERTLLSKNKASMLQKGGKPQPGDALTVDEAVRDPFVLEFLNLKDEYSETDLAQHTLDTLPNKVMAREYQLALPAAKKLEAELAATRKRLERKGMPH